MFQVAAAGIDGRDLIHAFGGAERQQGRGAVDAGVREPAFGGGDQAAGVFDAALLRQTAGDEIGRVVPRKAETPGGKIAGAGQVEERGQETFLAHFAGIGELRDAEQLHVGGRERVGVGEDLRVRNPGVGGAEIDADDVFGCERFLTQFRFPPGR